ncbi:unnamed protein product [Linum trigynum]|uniref:CCHC-type domain-containing protein n=1 Tax=Linum trigynum TaxID=586398 RepID=A0AAV2FUT7_9ROSI
MLCNTSGIATPPATVPAPAGRPPDQVFSPPLSQPPTGVDPASFPPLNFKMALAGPTQNSPSKANQWTFVGEHDLESGLFGGEPELKVSEKFKDRLCSPWKKTLVVRLLGRSISYAYLCSQLRWKWRPTGRLDILDLNDRTFLVTFYNDQDFLHALTGGPWTILDHYLVVHQWSPSFRTSDKPHKSVVAWIQLPELPVHFYHREVLFALGNLIGRTVKLDYHTENLERGKFARLAVELDMTKPLATRIRLDGSWQPVLYENLPEICFECGRIGHTEEFCAKKAGTTATTSSNAVETSLPSEEAAPSPEVPAGYGPWMQVTRKSRKQNRKVSQNPASSQYEDTGRGGVSGKVNQKTSQQGKGDQIRINSGKDGKGKTVSKAVERKGNNSNPRRKADGNGNGFLTEKTAITSQEWVPIGPKKTVEVSQAHEGASNTSKQVGPSPTNTVTDQTVEAGGSGPAAGSSAAQIIFPSPTEKKENSDPNRPVPSTRHRSHKPKSQHAQVKAVKPKIMKDSSKKPLAQNSTSAKKLLQELSKLPNFPINPQSISEFMANPKRRADVIEQPGVGIANDLTMSDNIDQATTTPPAIDNSGGHPVTES